MKNLKFLLKIFIVVAGFFSIIVVGSGSIISSIIIGAYISNLTFIPIGVFVGLLIASILITLMAFATIKSFDYFDELFQSPFFNGCED